MKTSDLIDEALNWAVDKALNLNTPYNSWGQKGKVPAYSTDWSHGGPIFALAIDKYIRVLDADKSWVFVAYTYEMHMGAGSTPLIAAMRCFVASKLGNNIDIPEEVLGR